jgi:TatA/E family protein of Tat protein translocase
MLSFWHILLLLLIVVILFGPSRLEQLGPSLGRAIRGFKEGLNGELEGDKKTPTRTASTDVNSQPENKI